MKNLLTTLTLCVILLVGCGKNITVSDNNTKIPPLPKLNAPDEITKIVKSGRFACMGSEIDIGSALIFTKRKVDSEKVLGYTLWLFDSKDVVLVEFDLEKTKLPGRTWIDLGGDGKIEHFFEDPTPIPGFPDICKTLNRFRNLNDRKPSTQGELGKTSI
jgi:hypothetical protein